MQKATPVCQVANMCPSVGTTCASSAQKLLNNEVIALISLRHFVCVTYTQLQ
jgi:hypothetical protein